MPKYAIYERSWADFIAKGFTEADLCCVILFLQRENRRNTYAYSLRLGKLLDFRYHHFADLLAEAQAKNRNRRHKLTGKDQVLAQYERKVNPELTPVPLVAKSIRDVLKSLLK